MIPVRYDIKYELRQKKRKADTGYDFSGCPYKAPVPGLFDRNGGAIMHDCGKCLYCLVKKQSKLEFYAKKELYEQYKAGKGASFVTLTYSEDYQPIAIRKEIVKGEKQYPIYNLNRKDGKKTINNDFVMVRPGEIKDTKKLESVIINGINTLYRKDFKDFMKRFRRQMEYYKYKGNFKVIYCGEYGDKLQRSHMHMVLLGLTAEETEIFTRKTWKYGLIDIGPLGAGGIRYLIDYVTKSQTTKKMKELLDKYGVEPPFIYHSIRMGLDWIIKHAKECEENNFYYYSGKTAKKTLLPIEVIKTMCRILGRNYNDEINKIMQKRENEIIAAAQKKGMEPGLYKFEERIEKEMMTYNSIRADGKKPISPEYLTMIKTESRHKPKSRRLKPYWQLEKERNIRKLVEKLEKTREEDKETRLFVNDWIETKELINFVKCLDFFENCEKNA